VVAVGPTVPSAWREISRRHADAAGALASFDAVRAEYDAKAASLEEEYAGVVPHMKFGHVGSYGQIGDGTFQREFNGSWGTNVAQDVGANYYGAVKTLDSIDQAFAPLLTP
jgi:iron-siderophore transport system substrate-binding protein